MRKTVIYITGICLSLLTFSCNSLTVDLPAECGKLSVALSGQEVEVVVKAAEANDLDNYTVKIFNNANEQQHSGLYSESASKVLPFGTYYVTAENCTATEAEEGNGCMRLWGRSADVTLSLESLFQTADVSCEVQNGKITVTFDEVAKTHIDDLKVTLSNSTRTVTVAETDTNTDTWFNAGADGSAVNVSYSITGRYNGSDISFNSQTPLEIRAKSNYNIKVQIDQSEGQLLVPEVSFDTNVGSEDKPGSFNPYE